MLDDTEAEIIEDPEAEVAEVEYLRSPENSQVEDEQLNDVGDDDELPNEKDLHPTEDSLDNNGGQIQEEVPGLKRIGTTYITDKRKKETILRGVSCHLTQQAQLN